ncbi:hypothetical protein [Streptomyces chromofuscus]|uniref:Uncharacterized protein n=1 Tax=Streptomyces chromofuscus TaxID=42881 RepID=A0A7M2TFW4_STRCW|nr:hypothetical protein [Streptomyces chromofuscus]QOV47094.1 hypothetical protein IPT68_15165 [Streptomyces chromofuscus]GGT26305.1 hypothetical protein GCM10010254_53460 [Streptomyces chromofuscus]
MAHSPGKYADFEGLRERAVALRRAGLSLRQIRDELKIYNNDVLNQLVKGEPPPAWTKRPRAKDDLRAKARELRLQGWTYDRIEAELGCSRSSISLWVRDLPRPERPRRTRAEASAIAKRGWEAKMRLREEERRRTRQLAMAEIDQLTDRELFLVGVGLYWAEGAKSKPYSRRERITFVNSDPDMITVFLAWLRLLHVDPANLGFAVHIHETADVTAAEAFWASHVGIEPTELLKTRLKKHNPRTNRKNTGGDYHGCLRVDVRDGADLYRRIEGWWYGIVGAATAPDLRNRT